MKLSVTITDERHTAASPYSGTYTYSTSTTTEEYTRVAIAEADVPGPVLAGILRSIAAQIDPPADVKSPTYFTTYGGDAR